MCSTHSGDYCKAEIANLEKNLKDDGKILLYYGDGKCPYPSSFPPEVDTFADINEIGVHEYQQHIDVIRQAIQLGRINIMNEIGCM